MPDVGPVVIGLIADTHGLVRPDVHAMEWVAWSPLIALTLVLGVAPGFLLTPVAAAARAFFGGL